MDGHLAEAPAETSVCETRSLDWIGLVISLLEKAAGQLHDQDHPAQDAVLEAANLLRQRAPPATAAGAFDGKGGLLAWQAHKVSAYIEDHLTGSVRVADLGALLQLSEAHFSRSFRRTFGASPHSFVVRRRVELAARYMLTSDASLSDIALRCGFADQAHLCKQFRQATGHTPAAWRRARSIMTPPPLPRRAQCRSAASLSLDNIAPLR